MKRADSVKRIISGFYNLKVKTRLRKKVRTIIHSRQNPSWSDPPSGVITDYVSLWGKTGLRPDIRWLRMYGNICGIWDHRYIPESIYYIIAEPCLNNKSFSKCFTDKNLSRIFLDGYTLPDTVVSNIDGVFYGSSLDTLDIQQAKNIIKRQKTFIIKPSTDSGGGKDVTLWRAEGDAFVSFKGEISSVDRLLERYRKNYIIQGVIEQHPFYRKFNNTSVNTVRMLTYRSPGDEHVYLLHSILRVGAQGLVTDNQASGGFACGVTADGALTGVAIDKNGNRYNEVNGVPLEKGLKLVQFDSMAGVAVSAAKRFYYSRLLGFDLCIDRDGRVIVIEVNNLNNEINFFQMLNGPLFGRFSGEVAEWCAGRGKTFMIDFEV